MKTPTIPLQQEYSMNENKTHIIQLIVQNHKEQQNLPSADQTKRFIKHFLGLLFPSFSARKINNIDQAKEQLAYLETELTQLLAQVLTYEESTSLADSFLSNIQHVFDTLKRDALAIEKGDPAASGTDEVIASYPGFLAIAVYRIAHYFYTKNVPVLPRMMTEYAHTKTGIDIHPGATIGDDFVIDHGTGIVIGETTVIGNRVKIYQGVTLGALSVRKSLASKKRHPTIEDDVVIYAGATILGGDTIIGKNSTIGGNVWLTSSVDAHSLVYHQNEMIIQKREQNG